MWIHKTTAKLALDSKDKLIKILSTEEVFDAFTSAEGFLTYYLVEKLEDPEEMASITIWENRESGEKFYASPVYREILSGAVPLLSDKPQMETFNTRVDLNMPVHKMS